MRSLPEMFPVWKDLTAAERETLTHAGAYRTAPCGAVLHAGEGECIGLLLVGAGRLRGYILSEDGREVTLYRLFEGDVCLFTAACAMPDLQTDVHIETETDAAFWVIPAPVCKALMDENVAVAAFINRLMAARLSEVMWRMDQVLFQRFDRRLAAFLLDESAAQGTDALAITHERIARHMGSAREVVTRMLKDFQADGLVTLSRGAVTLADRRRLLALSK